MNLCFKWTGLLVLSLTGCASLHDRMSGSPERPLGFESKFAMARACEQQGGVNHALEMYSRLLADNSQNHQLHHRLGVIAVKQGRPDEAMKHFDRALEIAPNDGELITDIGYTLYLQGRHAEAEQHLRQAVAEDPKNERALNNLGLVLSKLGRQSQAYRVFRKTGSDAQAHANLAYAYATAGQLDLAERHYSRALDFDEGLTQASVALLQLEEIRRDLDETGSALHVARPPIPEGAQPSERTQPPAEDRMEDPDSPEFIARWGQPGRSTTPQQFQFTRELYEQTGSAETGVRQASGSVPVRAN